jgi:hypothetical protein
MQLQIEIIILILIKISKNSFIRRVSDFAMFYASNERSDTFYPWPELQVLQGEHASAHHGTSSYHIFQ